MAGLINCLVVQMSLLSQVVYSDHVQPPTPEVVEKSIGGSKVDDDLNIDDI